MEVDPVSLAYVKRGGLYSADNRAEVRLRSDPRLHPDEYGERFTIKDYETWYDEDNAELMKKVAKARGEEDQATGVPYIIIGNKSWIGFADEYKDEIKEQIDKVYGQDVSERYDILKYVKSGKSAKKEEKSNSSDVVALLCMIVVCGLIIFGIYKARKNTN